jgi:hypothetical protein
VWRTSTDNNEALLVIHSFAKPLPSEIIVDLPHGNWRIAGRLPGTNIDVEIADNKLGIQLGGEFEGHVICLENGV